MIKRITPIYLMLTIVGMFSVAAMLGLVRAAKETSSAQDRTKHAEVIASPEPKSRSLVITRPSPHSVRVIDNPLWHRPMNVRDLAARSHIIVKGIPTSNLCKHDGEEIVTEYQVTIEEVFKGNLVTGSTITVRLPGGVAGFENGGAAVELRPLGFKRMINHSVYVLFLNQPPNSSDILTPINGPQGLFELLPNGLRVRHYGRPMNLPPQNQTEGQTAAEFLAELRQVIR